MDIDSDGAAECHGFDGADLCPNDGNKIVIMANCLVNSLELKTIHIRCQAYVVAGP